MTQAAELLANRCAKRIGKCKTGPQKHATPPEGTLTPTQATVLEIIIAHVVQHGFPPTIREFMAIRGTTGANAESDILHALARKGFIKIHFASARAIQVLRDAQGNRVKLAFIPAKEP